MLILGVKPGEPVHVTLPDGRDGTVTLIRDSFGHVRLGFDFPKDVAVNREEIWQRIQGEANQ